MKKLLLIFSYSLYLFLLIGFYFHTSSEPQIFNKYTIQYFVLLVLLTLFIPIAILWLKFLSQKSNLKVNKRTFTVTTLMKLIVSVIILSLVLLPVESFLRYKYRNVESNSYLYTADNFDPFLQFKLTDNYTSHINSYGFRGGEMKQQKQEKTYRIFILGGSTVLNMATEYEKTSARLLEKQLQKQYPNRMIEVLNAGVDGYTSEHSLIQYLFKIKDFEPDLVIMWHGINDLYYSCSPPERAYGAFKPDYTHFWGADGTMAKEYFKPEPVLHFKLVTYDYFVKFMQENWFSDLFQWVKSKRPVESYYTENTLPKQYEMTKYPSLLTYQRNLKSLIKAVESDQTTLMLGNQPYLYKKQMTNAELNRIYIPELHCSVNGKYPTINSFMMALQKFNITTEKVAEENKVLFVDLNSKVPKNQDYFTDDVHYTDKGNERIAEALFKKIVSKELINP